jgi:hypothetical protein
MLSLKKAANKHALKEFETLLSSYCMFPHVTKILEQVYSPQVISESGRTAIKITTIMFPFSEKLVDSKHSGHDYINSMKRVSRFLLDSVYYTKSGSDVTVKNMLNKLTSLMEYNLSTEGEFQIINNVIKQVHPSFQLKDHVTTAQSLKPEPLFIRYLLNNKPTNFCETPIISQSQTRWLNTDNKQKDSYPHKESSCVNLLYGGNGILSESPRLNTNNQAKLETASVRVKGVKVPDDTFRFGNLQVVQDKDLNYPFSLMNQLDFQYCWNLDEEVDNHPKTIVSSGLITQDNNVYGFPESLYLYKQFPVGRFDTIIEISRYREKINESLGYLKHDAVLALEEGADCFEKLSSFTPDTDYRKGVDMSDLSSEPFDEFLFGTEVESSVFYSEPIYTSSKDLKLVNLDYQLVNDDLSPQFVNDYLYWKEVVKTLIDKTRRADVIQPFVKP